VVRPLEDAIGEADVVVTATGVACVVGEAQMRHLRSGAFLLNVGHRDDEIDLGTLLSHPHREVLPFVEEVSLGDRIVYLFAGGSMANLTAGFGDSLNAFDVTLAVMMAGIRHITHAGMREPPGLHILPRQAWEPFLAPRVH
jgi:adenosylhomocysteinase